MNIRAWVMVGTLGAALAAAGCDSYPKMSINCQVGRSNLVFGENGAPIEKQIASCEFTNRSKSAAKTCVRVKVDASSGESFTSPVLCSGVLLPDSDRDGVTDALERCPEQGHHSRKAGLIGSFVMDSEGCPTTRMNLDSGKDACKNELEARSNGFGVGSCLVSIFPDEKMRDAVFDACVKPPETKPTFDCALTVETVSR